MPARPEKPTAPRRRCFTLVELLATAALIAVIGIVLARFYANMQRAYSESLRIAVMGQDARAAFSLLTRDLRLAITRANDIPGQDIRIHQPADGQLWFVSANESGAGGSSLVELCYRLNGNVLERAEVDDRSDNWNPYGDRNDASTQAGFQAVVDRVMDFRITCYDRRLASMVPDQTTALPAMIGIRIVLLDGKSFSRWQALPTAERASYAAQRSRTFRATVQIPAAQFASQ